MFGCRISKGLGGRQTWSLWRGLEGKLFGCWISKVIRRRQKWSFLEEVEGELLAPRLAASNIVDLYLEGKRV
jgi:hypothetical protein